MNCPTCGHGDHRVLRTDAGEDRIVRTRECIRCGKRWRTAEVPADVLARADEIRDVYRRIRTAVAADLPRFVRGLQVRPTALYRHFDLDGALLYVGIAVCVHARTKAHRARSPWFPLVARIEVAEFATRAAAMEAERRAIKDECPRHNIRGRA